MNCASPLCVHRSLLSEPVHLARANCPLGEMCPCQKPIPNGEKMYEWYSNLHWVKAMLLSNWFLENLGCTYCRMATNIKGSFRFCVRSHSVWMDPHMWNMSWAISPKCRWQIIFVILISFSHYFWRIQL